MLLTINALLLEENLVVRLLLEQPVRFENRKVDEKGMTRMKRVFLALMMVALAGMASGATTAQMTICATGAGCVTVLDNGAGDLDNTTTGSIIFSGVLGAWTTNVQVGSSAGPGLSSIDLGSTAKAGAASTLTVTFSDINFTSTASSFNLDYSGATPVGGTATGKGWVDNTNTIFGTTTLVGSLGPFTGSFLLAHRAGDPYG
jgi:hypothetical protein